MGILGAVQAYAAYQSYLSFNEQWLAKKYFDSGAYLGAALVDAAVVLYLLLLAGNVSEAVSQP